jgi:hypothetical protein
MRLISPEPLRTYFCIGYEYFIQVTLVSSVWVSDFRTLNLSRYLC